MCRQYKYLNFHYCIELKFKLKMSKPNVPFQIGMRFAAIKKKKKVRLNRSKSPPAARTQNNFCDELRRTWIPLIYTDLPIPPMESTPEDSEPIPSGFPSLYKKLPFIPKDKPVKKRRKFRSKSVQPKRNPRSEPALYYRLENWMEDLIPLIYEKPITEIKMPGTHDSATYAIDNNSKAVSGQKYAKFTSLIGDQRLWTTTQTKSIERQLQIGSRFFDIRVSLEEGKFYTHHGLRARKLPYELSVIKQFLIKHPYEFIILKIKPSSTCANFLDSLQYVIHQILENHHILMKATFMTNNRTIDKLPGDLKMQSCAGKLMVIIDDRSFVEGKSDCPEIQTSKFFFGNTSLYSIWPNTRDFNTLLQKNIESQPPLTNKQLYCLHFTFTANFKYLLSHLNQKGVIYDIFTMTKDLEETKNEKTGSKSNWDYMISLLRTRPDKRDININVVDFLNGLKSHRLIFLNFSKNRIPPLPPPLKPNIKPADKPAKKMAAKPAEPEKSSKKKKKKSKS